MTMGLIALWLVPAAVFFALTYLEGNGAGEGRWTLWRMTGLVACLGWPLALPVFIVISYLHARSSRKNVRRGLRPQLIGRV